MPPPVRALLCRIFVSVLVLQGLTQCTTLDRFESPRRRDGVPRSESGQSAADAAAENGVEGADTGEGGPEKTPSPERDFQMIGAEGAPFYRWLWRSNGKPTRLLEAGTKVLVLKEDEEKKFSRIMLQGGSEGWIPSAQLAEEEAESANPGEIGPAPPTGVSSLENWRAPGLDDPLTPLEPSKLPGREANLPPATDLGAPIVPDAAKIIVPRSRPPVKTAPVGEPARAPSAAAEAEAETQEDDPLQVEDEPLLELPEPSSD